MSYRTQYKPITIVRFKKTFYYAAVLLTGRIMGLARPLVTYGFYNFSAKKLKKPKFV